MVINANANRMRLLNEELSETIILMARAALNETPKTVRRQEQLDGIGQEVLHNTRKHKHTTDRPITGPFCIISHIIIETAKSIVVFVFHISCFPLLKSC